ncbi:MAG: acireductone synthase [Gammaproteobacteria bacterium]|nr:acireductone synthase [Gammaproteobacteria bacterium]
MTIKAIVTDIEGTTSSISFVHEVLFPYAREHIQTYVEANAQKPEVQALLDEVRTITGQAELSVAEVIAQFKQWIAEDKKITPLKAIQGMIWEDGYRTGSFTGHIYDDSVRALRQWHQQGLALYVFSSGSVFAQKLLFGFSDAGDLTPLFSGYFDTNIGSKREVPAYQTIVSQLGLPADEIVFLSDIREELDAAREAGMHTIWFVRDASVDANAAHQQVTSFDAIDLKAIK